MTDDQTGLSIRFLREFDITLGPSTRWEVTAVPADDVPWGAAREIEPWAEVRLRCVLGHRYGGRVRSVSVVERDSPHADAGKRWSAPRREFEPWKCVVCGLVTHGLDGDDHGGRDER